MTPREEYEEKCRLRIEEMIRRDPSTKEVVASQIALGRTYAKLCTCFYRVMKELGMEL